MTDTHSDAGAPVLEEGARAASERLELASRTLSDPELAPLDARSAAITLALDGDDAAGAITDMLSDVYRRHHDDAFLAATAIEALGVLAVRSAHARTGITALLLRLPDNADADPDARYPRIAGCRAVGRVDLLQQNGDLRLLLRRWADRGDPLLQAEARMQLASITLADALLASRRDELLLRLGEARAAYQRAFASEEMRRDARCFLAVLDALLAFASAGQTPESEITEAPDIEGSARAWIETGLASPRSTRWALRLSSIARSLQRLRGAAADAEGWIRFDEALLELATLLARIGEPQRHQRRSRLRSRAWRTL